MTTGQPERRAAFTVTLPLSMAETLLRAARHADRPVGHELEAALRDGRFIERTEEGLKQ